MAAAAKEQLEQGLALARSAANWSGEGSALEKLGRMANGLGTYGEAKQYLEAARDLAQRNGDQGWVNWILCRLAENDLSMGHCGRANEQLLAVLKAYQMIGWPECEAYVALCLARSAYARAQFAEALSWLDQALEVDPGNEELDFQALYYLCRADVHAALGQVPQAISSYERSAAACRELNRPLAALEMQAGLALLSLSHGDSLQAKAHIDAVVAQFDAGWRPEEIVTDDLRVLLICHEVLASSGDKRAAEFLVMANDKMRARAELLEPSDREAFLGNVATNRSIVAAWDAQQPSQGG